MFTSQVESGSCENASLPSRATPRPTPTHGAKAVYFLFTTLRHRLQKKRDAAGSPLNAATPSRCRHVSVEKWVPADRGGGRTLMRCTSADSGETVEPVEDS